MACIAESFLYADYLTNTGKIEEALELNKKDLIQRFETVTISLTLRSQAATKRIRGDYEESLNDLNNALEIARRINYAYPKIEVLIERGRLLLDTEEYAKAQADLTNALKLIDRKGLKLYEPEAEVVLAEVLLAQGDRQQAKEFAESAHKKALEMNYQWPKVEAVELLDKISEA